MQSEQDERALRKQGNCIGKSSWEAESTADAATIDGLYSRSSISAPNRKNPTTSRETQAVPRSRTTHGFGCCHTAEQSNFHNGNTKKQILITLLGEKRSLVCLPAFLG